MKTLQIFLIASFFTFLSNATFAQNQVTEKFKVLGNCGMCEMKIEKAAKDAGASVAEWDKNLKEITVKYKTKSTDLLKIQNKIASVGYDNAGAKATDAAYDALHGCCKYERVDIKKTAKK